MFYFSVDSKYMLDVNFNELERNGVFQDSAFQEKFVEAIPQKLPVEFKDEEGTQYIYSEIIEDIISNEVFLRAHNHSPTSIKEALKIIREYFFHPPLRIIIGSKHHVIVGCWGSDISKLDIQYQPDASNGHIFSNRFYTGGYLTVKR